MKYSVFDKTLESIRNRVDIRLISSDKVAKKLARQAKVCSLHYLRRKPHGHSHEEDKALL